MKIPGLAKQIVAVALLLLCAFRAEVRAAEPSLLLLTEHNPPFNFIDPETGEFSGSGVALVKEIMMRAGIDYEIQLMPWRRAYAQVQKKANRCLFVMNETAERKSSFKWVSPIFVGGWAFYQKVGSDIVIRSDEDIRGSIIVGQTAAGAIEALKDNSNVSIIEVVTEETAYDLLVRGRGDLWLTGRMAARQILSHHKSAPSVQMAYDWRPAVVGMGCSLQTDDALIEKLIRANKSIGPARYDIIARYY